MSHKFILPNPANYQGRLGDCALSSGLEGYAAHALRGVRDTDRCAVGCGSHKGVISGVSNFAGGILVVILWPCEPVFDFQAFNAAIVSDIASDQCKSFFYSS